MNSGSIFLVLWALCSVSEIGSCVKLPWFKTDTRALTLESALALQQTVCIEFKVVVASPDAKGLYSWMTIQAVHTSALVEVSSCGI